MITIERQAKEMGFFAVYFQAIVAAACMQHAFDGVMKSIWRIKRSSYGDRR
jgi:hypothetical protein